MSIGSHSLLKRFFPASSYPLTKGRAEFCFWCNFDKRLHNKGIDKMPSLPQPPTQQVPATGRAMATMEPPAQYWPRFQQQWLERVGQATFSVKRECLAMRRQRDTGHWYVSLNLGPGNHNFPVYDPHISIGVFNFESYTNMWMAWIEMSSLQFDRQVVGHFGRYGQGMNFLVLPGCELFALILLLREKAAKRSAQSRDVRDPHITWNLI